MTENEVIEAKMPSYTREIMTALVNNGYEAYAVGGCIRDCLLALEPNDWDVCTSALPEQIIECMSGYRVVLTGLKHGTVTVVAKGDVSGTAAVDDAASIVSAADVAGCTDVAGTAGGSADAGAIGVAGDADVAGAATTAYSYESHSTEVTTFRIDGEYSDNRHPDNVSFVNDVREDLARRDFTVNAMAYSIDKGFIDCFGGAEDLRAKIIRCVGDPDKRFAEDGLRIMRAIRFSSTYGFTIEENTDRAIRSNRDLLKNISAERISVELDKLILGDGASWALEDYSDILAVIIPEIIPMFGCKQNVVFHIFDVWKHTLVCIENSPQQRDIRLALLLHDIGKPVCYSDDDREADFCGHAMISASIAEGILKRLKYDNQTIQIVTHLIIHHADKFLCDKVHIKHELKRYGVETLRKQLVMKRADSLGKNPEFYGKNLAALDIYEKMMEEILDKKEVFSLRSLFIDGKDLIAAGIPEGRRIGEVLDALLDMVIEGVLPNEKSELLAAIKRIEYQED